jgi:hypothetical protein
MSADGWDTCPRCENDSAEKIKELELALADAYGNIELEDWLAMKEETKANIQWLESQEETWRENYEFYGANTGTLSIRYGAYCTKCGLEFEYEEDVEFYQ